mmetsp:Transcript_26401/g.88443  ORF Transcript_26401/g.88443 Transcript_26401/m.88443 type:complete len:368 (-) Transcript_26401:182-1285(-)
MHARLVHQAGHQHGHADEHPGDHEPEVEAPFELQPHVLGQVFVGGEAVELPPGAVDAEGQHRRGPGVVEDEHLEEQGHDDELREDKEHHRGLGPRLAARGHLERELEEAEDEYLHDEDGAGVQIGGLEGQVVEEEEEHEEDEREKVHEEGEHGPPREAYAGGQLARIRPVGHHHGVQHLEGHRHVHVVPPLDYGDETFLPVLAERDLLGILAEGDVDDLLGGADVTKGPLVGRVEVHRAPPLRAFLAGPEPHGEEEQVEREEAGAPRRAKLERHHQLAGHDAGFPVEGDPLPHGLHVPLGGGLVDAGLRHVDGEGVDVIEDDAEPPVQGAVLLEPGVAQLLRSLGVRRCRAGRHEPCRARPRRVTIP